MIRLLSIGLLLTVCAVLMPVPNEKFWAHRCNSLEKFRLMTRKYSGVEIDATFYPNERRGRKFDVSHDAKLTVEYPLEEFMPLIADCDNSIWFDFKNLTSENASDAVEELERLLEQYSIDRRRFVIESHEYESLKEFGARGYRTAYCVPIHASAYDAELDRDWALVFRDEGMVKYFSRVVREAEADGSFDAVTFPRTYYRLVERAELSADLMTWDTHGERWWDFYLRADLRAMLLDERVKVILVDAPTDFDR